MSKKKIEKNLKKIPCDFRVKVFQIGCQRLHYLSLGTVIEFQISLEIVHTHMCIGLCVFVSMYFYLRKGGYVFDS